MLTGAERDLIRQGVAHMACPKPGELGACGCPDVYEAVERILADRERRARVEGAVEALREAADASEAMCWCQFGHIDTHNRTRSEVRDWLRDRADRIEGGEQS